LAMARTRTTVDHNKKVKVLVKKMKLECKPVQVRVKKSNLKVKSVCVRLQKMKVKVRNVKVNLKSVDVEEHVKRKDQNQVTCSLNKNIVRILSDEASPMIVDCLVKGKGTRSPICSIKTTIIPPYVNYELGSQKSIEEDDEENPKKRVPDWAQESSVMRALPNMVDPDHIFETCEPPDLLDMFPYPATTSTRRDICNSPVQSNIIDSTYVVGEESFVSVDCLNGLHDETYVVSKKYQKGESFSVVVNDQDEANATKNKEFHVESWSDEEEENEVTFDFSIRDPVEFASSNYA